jgi:hypothetical protein
MENYKPEPVYTWMCLTKSLMFPFTIHSDIIAKLCLGHRYSYEWQDIWMLKEFPHHDLLAEPL